MTSTSSDEPASITFVIGAGASNEVNLPTGFELKSLIAKSLSFTVSSYRELMGGDELIRDALYQLAQRRSPSNGDINDYARTARLIESAMPQAPSIDNFIDSHRSDPRVAECGKLAIAAAILKSERSSLLHIDPSNSLNRLRFGAVADTWLNSFFQLVTRNAQSEELSGRLRKIRIISFNYDRCVEHYLYHSLQNYYALAPERAAELMSELIVLHPYGSIGPLPWQQSKWSVPFGAEVSSSDLLTVASSLRTFTEGTDASASQIALIRSSVMSAERLVFLGFAYHELNLQVLFDHATSVPFRQSKQVFGTACGLSESDKRTIATELANLCGCVIGQVTLRRELTAAQVLPEYSRSLRI